LEFIFTESNKKGLCPADSFERLLFMPKPVLGRDLGALMGSKEGAPPVTAGVRSLMRGNAPREAPSSPGAPPKAARGPVIPRWYLFAGDILLVALALATIFKSQHPLSLPRVLFCAALVLLAAALALVAVFMRDPA
jgi:hypothetical protein